MQVRPVISEKSMQHAAKRKYTFIVPVAADKIGIKKAIEKLCNVHIQNVATSIIKGRTKRVGKKRDEIKRSPIKKAVVTVKAGEKIDMFDVKEDK